MRGSESGYTTNGSDTGQPTIETLEHSIAESFAEDMLDSTMPNCSQASTPVEKFSNYSLDPNNPNSRGKAEAYRRALGYTKANADELRDKIHEAVSLQNYKPYEVSQTKYGTKYKYRIPITGPNGKTKNVIAVYQIDKGQKIPRLITNYVEGK